MTTAPARPARAGGDAGAARRAATSALLDETVALVRLAAAVRAQDRSAHQLLPVIGRCGPLRQSALAERAHTDPSTISRHVAELVAQGLVQRLPDPGDGRASLLALTPAGTTAVDDARRAREERAAAALSSWTTEELTELGAVLRRYTTDLAGLLTGPAARPAPHQEPQEDPSR